MKESCIKAIENGCLYEFIATCYWRMTKNELKDVILELCYALSNEAELPDETILEELKERWEM